MRKISKTAKTVKAPVKKVAKKAPVAKKTPVTQVVEKMVSSLAIKSTQSITGKVKYLKDAVMVGDTLVPMTAILAVANNTVFYTKFSKVGTIAAVEQKNGLVAYKLENGAIVAVVDPSAVQVMVETVKEEVPVAAEEEPEEEDEEEEEDDVEDENEEDEVEEEEDDSEEDSDDEEEEEDDSEDEEEEEEDEDDSDDDSEDEEDSDDEEEDEEEDDDDDDEEEDDDDAFEM